jgi:hypothetical protein
MAPYVIPGGTNYADAIRDMVRLRLPHAAFELKPPTKLTTPELVYGLYRDEPNPWAEAELLATAIGYRLRFRRNKVTAYIPFGERLEMARWRFVHEPIRKLRRRFEAWRNPPVEWPDPDYSD